MVCTANWQQAFWPKHLILYLWIDTMIQSEVYSPGRSLEDSAPIKLDIDVSYFSLAHRRLQCKHCKAFPGCWWILFPLLFVFHLLEEAAPPSLSCDRWGAMCSWMAGAGAVSPDSSPGCDSAEATGGSSGHSSHHGRVQAHSWLNEYFKQLDFCQVRTHSQTERSSQDKACPGKSLFLIWHCSLEQEGSDPRTATAGVCLWRRFKIQP